MCTQPTYFRTLCEWTLCNRPHSASHPRLGGDPICGRLWPLPLFVLIFTSAKQPSVPGETLCPHRQTGRKLCNKIPKTWMVSSQDKKKERKHVVHHITQTLSPQSELQREYKIPPGEEKNSKCIQKSKMMQ